MNVSKRQNDLLSSAGTNKPEKATLLEQQLQLLTHLASELLAAKDPVAVVQMLFSSMARQFGIDVGFNYATNGGDNSLHLNAYLGIPEEEAQRIEQLAYGQAICGTVAELRRSLYVNHIQQAENPKAQLVKGYGVRVYACYPLLANEHLLGTLSFASRRRDTFEQEELDFFRTISQYVALAQERLYAERALRASEEMVRRQLAELEIIYETAPVGLCVLDTDLRYVRVNKRLAEINGRSAAAHIGRTVREIVPNLADDAEPSFRQVIETGTPILNVEISGETGTQGGAQRSWLEHFYPVKSLDGQVTGINVVVEEITERKQAEDRLRRSEEELQRLNETLEERVRIRTEEVRWLASELTLAEQRERQRISQILHDDIQQMLVALQINLHLIGESLTDTPAAKNLRDTADSVSEVVNATRNLAMQLNSPALRSEHLDEVFDWLAKDMNERYQLQVELEVDGDCRVESEARRELIVQLVRELLFNVVKHAQINLVHLSARDERGQLVIRVEDNGRGFNATELLGSPMAKGGLGLYSIKERIGLYGGQFMIESVPGSGTRATVTIPRAASNG